MPNDGSRAALAHHTIQDTRPAEPRPHAELILAIEYFGEIEAALDKQIYPEQVNEDFDAPADREYDVTLTAAQWRRYSSAMLMLEALQRGLARDSARPPADGTERGVRER